MQITKALPEQTTFALENQFDIRVVSEYVPRYSNPEKSLFTFSYTITITNLSPVGVRLLWRYWHITDAENVTVEIDGEGVIGVLPWINSGESFQYSSDVTINTPVGSMSGRYKMSTIENSIFYAEIPTFTLAIKNLIN